jgi:DNA-binding transcriptional MocR family regulator
MILMANCGIPGCQVIYEKLLRQYGLLGTFSKTVLPGFRLGWVVASGEIMEN